MTDRLISLQAAIDAMEQAKEQYFDRRVIIEKMEDIVSNLPSAQPEIIHCRECKHWHINHLPVVDKHGCDKVEDFTKPNFYCGWAERREE